MNINVNYGTWAFLLSEFLSETTSLTRNVKSYGLLHLTLVIPYLWDYVGYVRYCCGFCCMEDGPWSNCESSNFGISLSNEELRLFYISLLRSRGWMGFHSPEHHILIYKLSLFLIMYM